MPVYNLSSRLLLEEIFFKSATVAQFKYIGEIDRRTVWRRIWEDKQCHYYLHSKSKCNLLL